MKVKYAVIPCAGKGTRFLPITNGIAKEMCPIIDRPTLDYIVDECISGGITDIVFIISRDKEDIKKYYTRNEKFEQELIAGGKAQFAEAIRKAATKARYHYVIQEEALGLGHAVLQAKSVVGNNPFIVCCGDDICTYEGDSPVKQMCDAFDKFERTIVGGSHVEHSQIVKYGAMDIKEKKCDRTYSLKGIIEKPKLEEAPSDFASLGKWVFPGDFFSYIEKTPKGKGGEIQLTDAIALELKDREVLYYDFVGRRYDCGDKLGYLTAIIDIGLKRDDLKEGLKAHIKSLNLD